MDLAARARDASLPVAQRKARGVVHTPVEVARAMILEADALLARRGLPGVGDAALEIVDPATGPGVFLAAVLTHARGAKARLVGIDVDAEAFSPTRRSLARMASARGWALGLEVRDALAAPYASPPYAWPSVGASGREGGARLVVGNPPWSARGVGPPYVESLVRDFHVDEHGEPLRERRRGVLADAYVRFVRWAADAVERAPGGGGMALVTSSSYLDGPIHRGVRAFLASRFDEITILDLGGSALVAREPGVIDANVFGVRPGAAILVAVREPRPNRLARVVAARVAYGAVHGSVEEKLGALARPALQVAVTEPLASLRPRARVAADYARWPSLAEWLPFHAEGVQSNRDELVFDRGRGALLERLEQIAKGRVALSPRPHFDPRRAVRALAELREREGFERHVCEVAYRPFDVRWAFLHPSLCHRPRPPLLAATAQSSLVLVSVRQDRGSLPWSHVALVSHPIDNCYLSARSSCRARAFPTHGSDGVRNVSPRLWRLLGERGIEAEPRSIVAYLAAVLSSRVYVRAHADALALDYPRVPLPRDASVLATLAALGERLAACLATTAEPVRARAGCELVRVGHHAFDPSLPAVAALSSVRHEIDAAFGVLRLAECSEKN